MPMLPGFYRIKLLAHDGESGKMGSYEMPFTIPDLNRDNGRVAMNSGIRSSQRVDLKGARFSPGNPKAQQAHLATPLLEDG